MGAATQNPQAPQNLPPGVDPIAGSQQAAPAQPLPELNFQQAQAPGASNQANVLATIMNLAAIGTNVAGAATGRGAVGAPLVQSAQDIVAKSAADEKQKLDLQQNQDAALKLWPVAKQVLGGNEREFAKTLLEQGKYKEAEALINQARIIGREGAREFNKDVNNAVGGLKGVSGQLSEQEKAIKNSPEYGQSQIGAGIESLAKTFTKAPLAADIKNKVNENPKKYGFSAKITDDQAKEVLSKIEEQRLAQTKPIMNNMLGRVAKDYLGIGTLDEKDPNKLYAGLRERFVSKEAQKQLESVLLENGAQKKQVQNLILQLRSSNQGTQKKALKAYEEIVGGAPITGGPEIGTVENGFKYKGGNPADKNSWVKVK